MLGLLPSLLYLSLMDSWLDFLQRTLLLTAPAPRELGIRFLWLDFLLVWKDAFWPAAGLGFVWFAISSLGRGPRSAVRRSLDPSLAAIPALTAAWISFLTLRFSGAPDLLLLLPSLGLWTAWLVHCVATSLAARGMAGWKPTWLLHRGEIVLVAVALLYAVAHVVQYRPEVTLREQRERVEELTAGLAQDARIVAFEAAEVLALSERRSAAPFLRTHPLFMRSALLGPGGCTRAMQTVLDQGPALIVLGWGYRHQACVGWLLRRLRSGPYTNSTVEMTFPELPGLYDPRYPQKKQVRWIVFKRTPE